MRRRRRLDRPGLAREPLPGSNDVEKRQKTAGQVARVLKAGHYQVANESGQHFVTPGIGRERNGLTDSFLRTRKFSAAHSGHSKCKKGTNKIGC